MSLFDKCVEYIIEDEGGYVDHPADPGGATKYGCTKKVWEEYVGHEVTKDDIKNLTKDDVKPIYKKRYWDAIHGDVIPEGLSYCLFDTAINSGVGRASRIIQEMVGVFPDGAIGNNTLFAVNQFKDIKLLINEYCDKRLTFLKTLKTWDTFGKGWANRVEKVRQRALQMVN